METSFVLDFSKQEEIEKKEAEVNMKEEISKRLDELLSVPSHSSTYKNIAVDRGSSALKDDRGTNADELYKEAERLQAELSNGSKAALYEDARTDAVDLNRQTTETSGSQAEYSGPSVVSYHLDGRKARHLPVPAYRCMGEGRVTVIITVDPSGRVVNAKVQEETSSSDGCLKNYAIRAARMSRFSADESAPAKQMGDITYEFIAQ